MEFANPWFMAAGGALVSSPILIHLINRMRFKRIRWAAMEFLLKSQKRNRRKLIIEQLILLALRCLLVLLAGLLLGRLRLGGDTGQNAFHLAVVDDTPSMGDHFVENGKPTNSFEVAKEQIKLLTDTIAQASTRQQMRVVLLSDLDNPIFEQQLTSGSADELAEKLKDRKPSSLHIDPIRAVEKAMQVFSNQPRGKKVFHFISDFRERDWKGPDSEALAKAVDSLIAMPAHVSLIDTAHTYRGVSEESIAPHANLSIMELRPQSTIAAEGVPVEFTVGVQNFSNEPKTTFLHVFTRSIYVRDGKIDDTEPLKENFNATGAFVHDEPGKDPGQDATSSKTDALPPHQLTEHKFQLSFEKKQAPQESKLTDKPEERDRKRRADAEFVQVRVQIDDNPQDTGLAADNVRDVVLAVVRKVPVLVVDGTPEENLEGTGELKENSDLYYLRRALRAAVSYRMERCTVEELDKIKLDSYPDVFLVNVPLIKNEDTLKKLSDYVAKGGSLAYFLGDKTQPDFYNNVLFKQYENPSKEHLFPVLLDPLLPEQMSPDEMQDRLQNDKQPKILFPDESHPIVRGRPSAPADRGGLVKNQDSLRYLMINRYWKCQPESQWDPAPRQAQKVIVLPNRNSIDQYKRAAQEYLNRAVKQTADLASDDEKFEPYKARIEQSRKWTIEALGSPYMDPLIRVLDDTLHDPGVKDNPSRPNLPELWANQKMRGLKDEIDAFVQTLKYGDPLVVTRPYGKGKVLAFLTTAGTSPRGLPPSTIIWNEWASGLGGWSYPVFIKQMQEYLVGDSDSRIRTVGADLVLPELDSKAYKPSMRISFQPQPSPWKKAEDAQGVVQQPALEPGQPLTLNADSNGMFKVPLTGDNAPKKPGVYTFEFYPIAEPGTKETAEVQAYAFNIDSQAESDLSRAPKEALVRKATVGAGLAGGGKVALRSPGDSFEDFKDPPPELSNMVWLFVLIGLVFVVEQALAVHLSFHLKESEAAVMSAPAPRAAAA
jgi:hypothetical protein